jgi:hypothetical protein
VFLEGPGRARHHALAEFVDVAADRVVVEAAPAKLEDRPLEFPLEAVVANTGRGKASQSLADVPSQRIQGGKIVSYTYGAEVESVQVLLQTEDRNMKAKIELTQGPNQPKQIIEVFATVGGQTPFYAVIATPGAGSTIRVVNQNSVEFPINAWILPYKTKGTSDAPVTMGGGGWL